ncbi:MAG: hypothetical protein K0M64_14120 [Rhizobium sp.]|nr:hypothetical protein [Rhizobium sp.]
MTEGVTDQIVLEELVGEWLDGEDFIPSQIQPPGSDAFDDLGYSLSQGWKGVVEWCRSRRAEISECRRSVIANVDLLVIHLDSDVADDPEFIDLALSGQGLVGTGAEIVRAGLLGLLPEVSASNVVLCTPARDIECWVLCALFPDLADRHLPIEVHHEPGALLVGRPHKLVRRKDGRLRKIPAAYAQHAGRIVEGWGNCVDGEPPRCPEALRFMDEVKAALA